MNPDFDLLYYRKSDDKPFQARRIDSSKYQLLTLEGDKISISKHALRKDYRSDRKVALEKIKGFKRIA